MTYWMRLDRCNVVPDAELILRNPGIWLTHNGIEIGICNGNNFISLCPRKRIDMLAEICSMLLDYNPETPPPSYIYTTKDWSDINKLDYYYLSLHHHIQIGLKFRIDKLPSLEGEGFSKVCKFVMRPVTATKYYIQIRYPECTFNSIVTLYSQNYHEAAIEYVNNKKRSTIAEVLSYIGIIRNTCLSMYKGHTDVPDVTFEKKFHIRHTICK